MQPIITMLFVYNSENNGSKKEICIVFSMVYLWRGVLIGYNTPPKIVSKS